MKARSSRQEFEVEAAMSENYQTGNCRRKLATFGCLFLALIASTIALADGPALDHKAQQAAPIKLGSTGQNSLDPCLAGTLGSLVTDDKENVYILSNNHVMARLNAGAVGETIQHSAKLDTFGCLNLTSFQVGSLSAFAPLVFGGVSTVDAAIARTDATKTDAKGTILDVGVVNPQTKLPQLLLLVRKAGRTTGDTHGLVVSINSQVNVRYSNGLVTTFNNQIMMIGLTPVAFFSQPGDSGSLVVTDTGNRGLTPNRPVGLLFAGGVRRFSIRGIPLGTYAVTFANPINAVLQDPAFAGLNLHFVGQTARPDAADAPADPNIQAAAQVKNQYADYLMGLPEVVGHGIGLSQVTSGVVAIQVYLRQATPEALQALPSSLGGIPVVAVEIGDIEAY